MRQKIGKIILATIAIFVFQCFWGWLTCGFLFNWVYSIEPTSIWKSPNEFPLESIMIFNIVFAFFFTLIYSILYEGLPGNGFSKGLWYGLIVWIIGPLAGVTIFGMMTIVAREVVIYQISNLFVLNLLRGWIVAKIYK